MSDRRLLIGYPLTRKDGRTYTIHYDRVHRLPPSSHFLTVAPSRSGKGRGWLVPNLLSWPGSVFVFEPRGDLAWLTAAHRRALGQRVYILDPWKSIAKHYGVERTARFNPLTELKPDAPDFDQRLREIAEAIFRARDKKEEYWVGRARNLLCGVSGLAIEAASPTFREVWKFFEVPRHEQQLVIETARKMGRSHSARGLARFAAQQDSRGLYLPSQELENVQSTIDEQFSFIADEMLLDHMDQSDFSMTELANGNTTIYCVLPPELFGTAADRWLRLVLQCGIGAVIRARPRERVLFLLDEFGTVGHLSAVERAVGLMAGGGICLWLFVQSLHQMKQDYPNSHKDMIANAQASMFYKVRDLDTARLVSDLVGDAWVKRTSTTRNPEDKVSTSEHHQWEREIKPEAVIESSASFPLAFWDGRPRWIAPVFYDQEPRFNGLYRPLPEFPAAPAKPRGAVDLSAGKRR